METSYKLYEVGGCVRDEILGIESKDIDYTVVVSGITDAQEAFQWLQDTLSAEGCNIFATKPEVFTIRARYRKDHPLYPNLLCDFVMARKEEGYIQGTRLPSHCVVGTLEDDLRRRDFTVNAIAKDPLTGELIDPFCGVGDLKDGILCCPVNAETSFNDDPLRAIRALRFSVTKGLYMSKDVRQGIVNLDVRRYIETVSLERTREELTKMFKFDTHKSFKIIQWLETANPNLYNYITMNLIFVPKILKNA